jgi:hypothetical protein
MTAPSPLRVSDDGVRTTVAVAGDAGQHALDLVRVLPGQDAEGFAAVEVEWARSEGMTARSVVAVVR